MFRNVISSRCRRQVIFKSEVVVNDEPTIRNGGDFYLGVLALGETPLGSPLASSLSPSPNSLPKVHDGL